jgi:hypothetical protein
VGDPELAQGQLELALNFHRNVTDKAAMHLKLLANNAFRTPWVAAKLLAPDKNLARTSAIELVSLLASVKVSNRTSFEQHLLDAGTGLWQNLVAFAQADPPVCLWHGHGAYATLFRFLAPRFLLAPDHVLDAERVHARWQWSCTLKRGLKMHSLNSCLRLTHYLEHNECFPSNDKLYLNLEAERVEHKLGLEVLEELGEVASGWRHL